MQALDSWLPTKALRPIDEHGNQRNVQSNRLISMKGCRVFFYVHRHTFKSLSLCGLRDTLGGSLFQGWLGGIVTETVERPKCLIQSTYDTSESKRF